MPVRSVRMAAAAVILLVFAPGCITLFSKTEYVRSGEPRRAVSFENPQAADSFHAAVKKQSASVGGAYVGVPFVTLYSNDRVLAEAARFNDAVAKCDTDQDGIITCVEAQVFAKTLD